MIPQATGLSRSTRRHALEFPAAGIVILARRAEGRPCPFHPGNMRPGSRGSRPLRVAGPGRPVGGGAGPRKGRQRWPHTSARARGRRRATCMAVSSIGGSVLAAGQPKAVDSRSVPWMVSQRSVRRARAWDSRARATRACGPGRRVSKTASPSSRARTKASRSPRLSPWPATGCSICAALPIHTWPDVVVCRRRTRGSGTATAGVHTRSGPKCPAWRPQWRGPRAARRASRSS